LDPTRRPGAIAHDVLSETIGNRSPTRRPWTVERRKRSQEIARDRKTDRGTTAEPKVRHTDNEAWLSMRVRSSSSGGPLIGCEAPPAANTVALRLSVTRSRAGKKRPPIVEIPVPRSYSR
jgi:hypothetical protein